MAKQRSKATRRAQSEAASARAAAIRKEQERRERRRRSLVVTLVGIAVLAIIVVVAVAVRSSSKDSGGTSAAPAGAVGGLAIPAGKSSAPVKVVVYEDFICPFCKQFEAASRSEFDKDIAAGKLQVQYHVLGFLDRNSSTKYSSRAASATAVVLDTSGQTVAKKFHDLLFENQPEEGSAGLSDDQLVDYAVQAGAKKSDVQKPIGDKRYGPWVAKVTDAASKAKVTATPTVKLAGKTLQGSPEQLAAQIQAAVDKAS